LQRPSLNGRVIDDPPQGIDTMRSDDGSYRVFAIGLVKSVGFEGAVECARRYRWQRVLAELMSLGAERARAQLDF
jgi:hypothetical protein